MEKKEIQIVANKFRIVDKLGSGSFGIIWRAIHTSSNLEVAIKTEDSDNDHSQLFIEYKIYKYLHTSPNIHTQPIP